MKLEGDIKFFYETVTPGDIKITQNSSHLIMDKGLETIVTIALFTDKKADEFDKLPNKTNDRRGWWGDIFFPTSIGNRRWLLERSKLNGETLILLEQYDKEALQILIDENIADDIQISATRDSTNYNKVNMKGKIIREISNSLFFEYHLNWKHQIEGSI